MHRSDLPRDCPLEPHRYILGIDNADTMKTFKQYVIEVQAAGFIIEDLQALRIEYRRKYSQVYKRKYTAKRRRLELTLTLELHAKLKAAADENHMKIGQLAVRLIEASLHQTQFQAREDLVRQAVAEIKRVGTLTNQLVRLSHQKNDLHLDDLLRIEKLLQSLQVQIVELLSQRDFLEYAKAAIDLNPSLISALAILVLENMHRRGNDWH